MKKGVIFRNKRNYKLKVFPLHITHSWKWKTTRWKQNEENGKWKKYENFIEICTYV